MDHGFSLKQNTHCCLVMQPHLPQFNKYCLASLQRLGCPWQLDTITPLMSHKNSFYLFIRLCIKPIKVKGFIHKNVKENVKCIRLFVQTHTYYYYESITQYNHHTHQQKKKKKQKNADTALQLQSHSTFQVRLGTETWMAAIYRS